MGQDREQKLARAKERLEKRDKIYLNNYDINDFSLQDIRKNITYISQNEVLYNDTIRNNITITYN